MTTPPPPEAPAPGASPAPPESPGRPASPTPRTCPSCQQTFSADDELDRLCPECRERQTAIWVIAVFVVLFLCFVVLPLVVQGFRPFR